MVQTVGAQLWVWLALEGDAADVGVMPMALRTLLIYAHTGRRTTGQQAISESGNVV